VNIPFCYPRDSSGIFNVQTREYQNLTLTLSHSVFISFLFLGYVNYVYFVQIMAYHTFPEPVAKELRKAIYYDKGYGQDPKKAFHHYKEALFVATDLGMNPYSAEFMGMRIRMAEFLEQHRQFEQAIVVLEKERDLCYEYMEKARNEKEVPQAQWDRIVGAAVRLGVKLGKLYGDEEVDNAEAAQGAFVMAVETLLKERQRREEEGVQEEFLENEEIGGSLEELGHSYLDSKQPELALPLFLQALSLSPAQSCHRAMLSKYNFLSLVAFN
jgi:tetratricopeptide (TPR) repeat protein